MVSIQLLPWKTHWIIASKMRWTPKFCRISAVPSRKSARLKACSVVLTQSSVSNEIDLVFFRTARFFFRFEDGDVYSHSQINPSVMNLL